MLDAIRRRAEKDEEGFTLIELMVVVLIIGILVAIAVPTFLKAQENAKGKAAASNLRSGLSAGKTLFTENQSYTVASSTTLVAELKRVEPSLGWQSTASANPEEISVTADSTGNILGLATRSRAGFCYLIIDNLNATGGGTTYAKSTATATTCSAVTAVPGTGYTSGSSTNVAGW